MSEDVITIRGETAEAVSPEGATATMPVRDLFDKLFGREHKTGGVVYPDGHKSTIVLGPMEIWVYQIPPRVHSLHWIAEDSPAPYGPKAKYRVVRIALPYVIVLAVFAPVRGRRRQLTKRNECFFRVDPLTSLDDQLLFPGLLNCSKFSPPQGRPLSWICTQHLDLGEFARIDDDNERMRASFHGLLHCLFDAAFNRSSEEHEGASWYSETVAREVDPRIATIKAWEDATRDDPMFALTVPWLATDLSVQQVADRIFANHKVRPRTVTKAADLARVMHNTRRRRRKLPPHMAAHLLDAGLEDLLGPDEGENH